MTPPPSACVIGVVVEPFPVMCRFHFSSGFWLTDVSSQRFCCHLLVWRALDITWQFTYAVARGCSYFKIALVCMGIIFFCIATKEMLLKIPTYMCGLIVRPVQSFSVSSVLFHNSWGPFSFHLFPYNMTMQQTYEYSFGCEISPC